MVGFAYLFIVGGKRRISGEEDRVHRDVHKSDRDRGGVLDREGDADLVGGWEALEHTVVEATATTETVAEGVERHSGDNHSHPEASSIGEERCVDRLGDVVGVVRIE